MATPDRTLLTEANVVTPGPLKTALDGKATTSHHSTHAIGGSDPINPADIGAVASVNGKLPDSSGNVYVPTGGGGTGTGAVDSVNGRTGDVTLDAAAVNALPDTYVPVVADVTGLTAALAGKVAGSDPRLTDARTPTAHSHDDRYFTETESDARFVRTVNGAGPDGTGDVTVAGGGGGAVDSVNGKTGAVTLTAADVDALPDTYTPPAQSWGVITGKPSTFTPTAHSHAIADVASLQAALDGKQAAGSYATAVHTHAIANVTGLQIALDGKAATGHTHPAQTLSLAGSDLTLSGGGGTVTLPSGGGGGGAVSSVNDQTGAVSLDAAAVSAVASRNVRAYGAVGDGTADDTAAIQAAIDAGGLVSFDPGTYRITEPLVLKSGTILQGCHAPSYSPNVNPATNGSKIIAADGYTSGSLISVAGNAWGCAIYNMLICGNNQGADVHGVGLPQTIPGELSFRMRDVQIAGMSGAGIEGSLHVGQLYGVHIGRCGSNAIRVTGSNRWVDVKVVGMFAYFNMRSALYFAGGHTGAVEFSMCRFERSGQVFGDPDNTGSGFNSDEAGVRIRRGQFLSFLSCTTDANTGPGFHVDGQASAASQLTDISFMQCRASRDGGGDQDGPVDGAGFLVSAFSEDEANRPRRMSFTACTTATGRSNDGGGSGPISPRRGLSNTGAWQTVWHGRIPQVASGGTAFHLSGDNYGCSIFYATDDGRTFVWRPHVGAAVQLGGGGATISTDDFTGVI